MERGQSKIKICTNFYSGAQKGGGNYIQQHQEKNDLFPIGKTDNGFIINYKSMFSFVSVIFYWNFVDKSLLAAFFCLLCLTIHIFYNIYIFKNINISFSAVAVCSISENDIYFKELSWVELLNYCEYYSRWLISYNKFDWTVSISVNNFIYFDIFIKF